MRKRIFVRPLSVNFPVEVFENIYRITEEAETSMSDFVREAVKEKLMNTNAEAMTGSEKQY